ncbi:MAG: hypothetical protein AMXMBFR16_10820 [Candidatus Uhrbacteria bacterium]
MKNWMYTLAVVLGCGLVAVDHYQVLIELNNFREVRDRQAVIAVELAKGADVINYAGRALEQARWSATQQAATEAQLREAVNTLRATMAENKTMHKIIDTTAAHMAGLVGDNAALQKEADKLAAEKLVLEQRIKTYENKVKDLENKVKDLEAKVKAATTPVTPPPATP